MRLLLIAAFLCSTVASAQTIAEVNGGASNYFGSGAGVTLYGAGGETRFSGGLLNGRFHYSASQRVELHGWDLDVGDTQFFVSAGTMALTAPVRGLAVIKHGKRSEFHAFTGAIGDVFSSPYFFGIEHAKVGGGLSYKREIAKGFTLGTIQAVDVKHKTSLGEFEWKPSCQIGAPNPPLAGAGAFRNCWWQHVDLRGQAGILQNQAQAGGTANLAFNHLGATASRAFYVFAPQPSTQPVPTSSNGLPQRVTVDSGALFGGVSILTGNASVFRSALSSGKTYGAGLRLGSVQVQASQFTSRSKTNRQSGLMLTTTERLGLHLSTTQYASHSNGTWSYNAGMSWSSNRFSIQIGQSLLYYPLLQHPFQRTLNVNLTIRIRSGSVSVGTVALPSGKLQWNVGGTAYQPVPVNLPAIPGVASADRRMLPSAGHGGKHLVEVFVHEPDGTAVEGAAILIGNDLLYTNSQGRISSRQRKAVNRIMIDVSQFLSGEWSVVSAPGASDGKVVEIVVKHR